MSALRLGEVPPTAGLPPRFADLFGGGESRDFGRAIGQLLGVEDVMIEASGTACLLIAFEHLRRSSARRTVIVPAYTCPLVVLAAARAGLKVIACDTVREGFELDLHHLERIIGRDALCIVPTHYGGALTDVRRLTSFLALRSEKIAVIEDAAQAFGATVSGRTVGMDGDIGIFSFGAGKGFTIFEGGCLASRNTGLMQDLRAVSRQLTHPAPVIEALKCVQLVGYHMLYNPIGLRLVYGAPKRYWLGRGDEIRAAGDHFDADFGLHHVGAWRRTVGVRALPRLAVHLAAARATFDRICRNLSDIPNIKVHVPQPHQQPTATFVFVTLPSTERAVAAITALWRSRLGVAKMFAHAIGDYPYLAGKLQPSDTPNARDLARRTITISTSGILSDREVAFMVGALKECAS